MELSPEERVERVRMALAEAGYPHAVVSFTQGGVSVSALDDYPHEVVWKAYAVTGTARRCWACWSVDPYLTHTGHADPCGHDPLTSPWPEVVRP